MLTRWEKHFLEDSHSMAAVPALWAVTKQLLSFCALPLCEDTHIMSVVPTLLHVLLYPRGEWSHKTGPVPVPLSGPSPHSRPNSSPCKFSLNTARRCCSLSCNEEKGYFAIHFRGSDAVNGTVLTVCLLSPLCICHSSVFHLDFTLLDHRTQNHLRKMWQRRIHLKCCIYKKNFSHLKKKKRGWILQFTKRLRQGMQCHLYY